VNVGPLSRVRSCSLDPRHESAGGGQEPIQVSRTADPDDQTEIIRSITLWVSTSHSRCYATSRRRRSTLRALRYMPPDLGARRCVSEVPSGRTTNVLSDRPAQVDAARARDALGTLDVVVSRAWKAVSASLRAIR